MIPIKDLVTNKTTLDYEALCSSFIEILNFNGKSNWKSVLPRAQQQELFTIENLKFISNHEFLGVEKDIRPICLKKGDITQLLFMFVRLEDKHFNKSIIERITWRFIRGMEANRYIIWFFGNKAGTEFKVLLSGKEGKKIALKSLSFGVNQPYYKTYNFILDEVQSKLSSLFIEPSDIWKALWKSFDISIVNKKFYLEIKEAFDLLLIEIKKKGNPFATDEDRVQFSIRLIGRLLFCWFLKRKGIIKEDALSSAVVNEYEQNKNDYYHNLLETLFFDVFNTPEKERKGGIPKLISSYPFLNGGLFDTQYTDYKDNFMLHISNEWFLQFFSHTLERYNFTVDRNSTSNSEIAIDPEMLGRIFENLLAEQNPETGESARKMTGSFYTPREIVDFMVEQSIAEYLKNKLGKKETKEIEPVMENDLFGTTPYQQFKIPISVVTSSEVTYQSPAINEAIDDFVHTQHFDDKSPLVSFKSKIIEALNEIKVLDPACGSGAFPMGILQKIIALKLELNNKANRYKLKLDTIQNSIFGIDIQPMAIELSRLRCWLSLVVDEEIENIKPLPNLDFKFVCADSLIDVPLTSDTKILLKTTLTQLEENISQYFSPDFKSKHKIHDEIKHIITKIVKVNEDIIQQHVGKIDDEKKRVARNETSDKKLNQYRERLEEYSQLQSKWKSYENIFSNHKVKFFNTAYFFPIVKDKFDLVIANPPYINISNLKPDEYRLELRTKYRSAKNKSDTYAFFLEQGFHLLKSQGTLCYIIPQTWKATDSFSKLREIIFKEKSILKIVDLEFGTFEAIVKPMIVIISNDFGKYNSIEVFNDSFEKISEINISEILNDPNLSINTNLNSEGKRILKIIEKDSIPLESIIQFSRGIKTSNDSRFIQTSDKNKDYKKIFRGRNIKAFQLNWNGEYIWYRPDLMKEKVGSVSYTKEFFEVPEKIVTQRVSIGICAAYDKNQNYFLDTTIISNYPTWDGKTDLKFIVGLINSKVINFWFKKKYQLPTVGIYELHSIPIKIPKIQEPFIVIIDKILSAKGKNIETDTSQLEKQLDVMVYKLYELTYEEVKIIEPAFEMSKEDYEKLDYGFVYEQSTKKEVTSKAIEYKTKKNKGKRNILDDLEL